MYQSTKTSNTNYQVTFYENLDQDKEFIKYVNDAKLLGFKTFLILEVRGITTNWKRNVVAHYNNSLPYFYERNKRFWKFQFTIWGGSIVFYQFFPTYFPKLGQIPLPQNEMYKIEVFYDTVLTYNVSQDRKIKGVQMMLNLKIDPDLSVNGYNNTEYMPLTKFTEQSSDSNFNEYTNDATYNEYADNDLTNNGNNTIKQYGLN